MVKEAKYWERWSRARLKGYFSNSVTISAIEIDFKKKIKLNYECRGVDNVLRHLGPVVFSKN